MNLKLKTRIFIVVVLASIFLVLVLNVHKIKFGLSMLSIYNNRNKIEVVQEIDSEKKLSPIRNPLEDILLSKDENNMDEVKSIELKPTETSKEPTPPNKTILESPTNTTTIENTRKSYLKIIEEYNSTLVNLHVKFESDLNNLINQGIEDYRYESMSKSDLLTKYLNKGAELEKSSDKQFNSILKEMKKELEDNNHETSVIDKLSDYYNSFKMSKKNDIIDRGMAHMN